MRIANIYFTHPSFVWLNFQFIIMSDRFETLEEHLERFIENTRQLGIIVSDFQPQGQNALNQKL